MSDFRSAIEAGHGADGGEVDLVRLAYAIERNHCRVARGVFDWDAAWRHLERAHIIAQPSFWLHLSSHMDMLKFAWFRRDIRELSGQLFRIALVPLGALTGRLPAGNTGRARVSAFAPMPMPEDMQPLLRSGSL